MDRLIRWKRRCRRYRRVGFCLLLLGVSGFLLTRSYELVIFDGANHGVGLRPTLGLYAGGYFPPLWPTATWNTRPSGFVPLPAQNPYESLRLFRSSRLSVSESNKHVYVFVSLQFWLLAAAGFVLVWVIPMYLRAAIYLDRLCFQCGYDLRGTLADRCSECGMSIKHPPTRVIRDIRLLRRWPILVYAIVGSACACAFGPQLGNSAMFIWMPTTQIAQLAGPVVWLVGMVWPIVAETVPAWLAASALALMVLTALHVVLSRTRMRHWSSRTHVYLALFWFAGSHVLIAGTICAWRLVM